MKTYSRLLLLFLVACSACNKSSEQEAESDSNPTPHEESTTESATESSEAQAESVPEEEGAVASIPEPPEPAPEPPEPAPEPPEPAGVPEGWVPFESFPLSIDLPRFGEASDSLAGVTHLAGQPLKISYENLDAQASVSLREAGAGQWTVVADKDGDAPVASLRHEGNEFIWEWNANASKNTADSLRNGFFLFKSGTHEKRVALRKARVADSFTWNFNDMEERNRAAVARRSCVVDGVLPKEIKEMLFLEVQLPNGNIESGPATRLIRIKLPNANQQNVARLTAKWKITLQAPIEEGEEGNGELGGDTKIILEQQLQITIGGIKIPATMKKIHERDKQLRIQLRKAIDRKANFQAQLNKLAAQAKKIRRARLPPLRIAALLKPLGNQQRAMGRKFDIASSDVVKQQKIIRGAAHFGANVLKPLKGSPINYRLYLQRENDGKQIDLMRSPGF